ncbi:CLUMA_CG020558, isoform A [Clunio marinus]|uniref:CLUMA_CG020558, isoform A n=1 Tax=Clunio marinus TaxID=568069 RepID=A0A1J1J9B0_9DIPT|nr:CLUMA_CG020558, isoform A [Clunio marinus]
MLQRRFIEVKLLRPTNQPLQTSVEKGSERMREADQIHLTKNKTTTTTTAKKITTEGDEETKCKSFIPLRSVFSTSPFVFWITNQQLTMSGLT